MQPEITSKSWIMVGVLGLVWGSTFMLIEIALTGIPPFWLATYRLAIAAAIMGSIWLAQGRPLALDPENRPRIVDYIWVGAISSGVPFLLLNWGQSHVTSGFAGTTMAAIPLVVLPMAHYLVPGEQLSWRKVIGVGLGFVGVLLLVGANAFDSSGASLEIWGRLACIGVAVCYALNSVTIRNLPPVDSIGLTTMMMIVGCLVTLPASLLVEGPPPVPTGAALWALLALGVLSTAAMNFLRVVVIRTAGPTFLTLVNYQIPVWSVVLGALVLGEALPTTLLGALVLILTGVAISQWQILRGLFGGAPRR